MHIIQGTFTVIGLVICLNDTAQDGRAEIPIQQQNHILSRFFQFWLVGLLAFSQSMDPVTSNLEA
jgi:hypothetical protein